MKILIIGGNQFFGKKLAKLLVEAKHDVTLLNRSNQDDDLGYQIQRIKCDRLDKEKMQTLLADTYWDIVYDQVCFDYDTAKDSCEIFENKVAHYIFTSSQSVYNAGAKISEDDFNPGVHEFSKKEFVDTNYAEAKRQAEVGFEKHASFPATYVRFPIVIGHDDATQRFQFHLDRIKNNKEIHIPNPDARISFISSDDAAKSLMHIGENRVLGPINCCNSGSISIGELLDEMAKSFKTKAVIASSKTDQNTSPYSIGDDWFMSNELLAESELKLRSVKDVIKDLLNN
jgi:nucleoside-diphosphate-sugar epimerase